MLMKHLAAGSTFKAEPTAPCACRGPAGIARPAIANIMTVQAWGQSCMPALSVFLPAGMLGEPVAPVPDLPGAAPKLTSADEGCLSSWQQWIR